MRHSNGPREGEFITIKVINTMAACIERGAIRWCSKPVRMH